MGGGYFLDIDVELPPPVSPDRLQMHLSGGELSVQLRAARTRLADWACSAGLTEDAADDLVLAAYEALANVADHAYPDGEGEAWLDVALHEGCIDVTVCDTGTWRPPPSDPGPRGRGLKLIEALAQRVTVERRAGGTVVAMHWCGGPGPT